jgi:branched-chain amino acid transport system permease protein
MIFAARIFRETRLGLALRASRENEVAAAAIGIDVRQARFRAWVVSITCATLAGALYGHYLGAFSPKDFYFDLIFTFIAMLIVGGLYSTSGAVAGVLLLTLVIQILRKAEAGLDLGFVALPQVFGLPQLGLGLALLLTIWARPTGLAGLAELRLSSLTRKPDEVPPRALTLPAHPRPAGQALSVQDVTVSFGGLTALDRISFEVPMGQVTGLIGPNGAGKTTLINVICGQQRPSSGVVTLGGQTLSALPAHRVAAAGLARTFQERALALSPAFLLLDEPAAGMNPSETDQLIETLERLKAERDLGILVVEHDMRLIMRLSDRMVVLNKGQKIAEDTPDAVRANPAVIEAYIGTKRHHHDQQGS